MPYLSASAVVIHYEEAPYQVYAPLPFTLYSSSYKTCKAPVKLSPQQTNTRLLTFSIPLLSAFV